MPTTPCPSSSTIALVPLLCALAGCLPRSVVTASRVPVPVLVGPVERIGGASAATRAGAFDVRVAHTIVVGGDEASIETNQIADVNARTTGLRSGALDVMSGVEVKTVNHRHFSAVERMSYINIFLRKASFSPIPIGGVGT